MKCYLCGSQTTFFLKKNGYSIYRCQACGLAQTDLQKNYKTFLSDHYSKGYFTGKQECGAYINYKDDKPMIVRNMKKFLREIKKHKPIGKLLDVGCALGFFVELAQQNGYEAYGFDPSRYAVDESRKLVGKDRIQLGTISSLSYKPKSFDIITLFDVFEHLGDPIADIRKLKTLLKENGILVIATGDTESLMARILKRRWTFYIPPQHLFFFNKKLLNQILVRENFIPIEWFHIGKWLSFRYVLHLARTTGESKVADIVYHITEKLRLETFPLYLSLGDNMVVIAKNRL